MPFCPVGPTERQELLPTSAGQREPPRTWGSIPRLGLIAALLVFIVIAYVLYVYFFGLSPEGAPEYIEVQAMAYLATAIAKETIIATSRTKSIKRELDHEAKTLVLDHRQWSDVMNPHSRMVSTSIPPPDIARIGTAHGLCACDTGLNNITFWPDEDVNSTVTVNVHEIAWVSFGKPVHYINFLCDGMGPSYRRLAVNASHDQYVSVQLPTGINDFLGFIGLCNRPAGLPIMNTWSGTDYTSSVVWTSDTEGYACLKIPALLRTHSGTLIAFAEARTETCSDFAQTDLVFRRSTDGGKTWSATQKMVEVEGDPMALGLCGHALVIGNTAPVQLPPDAPRHPNRILAPYTRNNYDAWIVYSDDDGVTWQGDRPIPNVTLTNGEPDCDRGMSFFGYDVDSLNWTSAVDLVRFVAFLCYGHSDPYHNEQWSSSLQGPWQWVGIGPPGSTVLSNGNVLVPSYHSYIRGLEGDGKLPISQLYNNFALAHVMMSSDDGDTWFLGEDSEIGQGANENQMHELVDGSVLMNSRSLSTGSTQLRLQARSYDGGVHFSATNFTEIPQPFNGCQGSMIGVNDTIFVASPDPDPAKSMLQSVVDMFGCDVQLTGRKRLSYWRSDDAGHTYGPPTLIDHGLSAQTSLQIAGDQLVVLHEQSDDPALFSVQDILIDAIVENLKVLLPGRIMFRALGNISS